MLGKWVTYCKSPTSAYTHCSVISITLTILSLVDFFTFFWMFIFKSLAGRLSKWVRVSESATSKKYPTAAKKLNGSWSLQLMNLPIVQYVFGPVPLVYLHVKAVGGRDDSDQ